MSEVLAVFVNPPPDQVQHALEHFVPEVVRVCDVSEPLDVRRDRVANVQLLKSRAIQRFRGLDLAVDWMANNKQRGRLGRVLEDSRRLGRALEHHRGRLGRRPEDFCPVANEVVECQPVLVQVLAAHRHRTGRPCSN